MESFPESLLETHAFVPDFAFSRQPNAQQNDNQPTVAIYSAPNFSGEKLPFVLCPGLSQITTKRLKSEALEILTRDNQDSKTLCFARQMWSNNWRWAAQSQGSGLAMRWSKVRSAG